ncbi:MAG: hypothetical protein ACXW1S_08325 [Acidimicrobiia bacterium]
MPTFLSPAWIAALDAALSGAILADSEPFTPFTLRQVVTDRGSGTEFEYRVALSDQGIRVTPGTSESDPTAELDFETDYDTAVALNRGELSAQEALESGRLEVRGRLDRITGARKLLVALDDAARELRATTTYDPGP